MLSPGSDDEQGNLALFPRRFRHLTSSCFSLAVDSCRVVSVVRRGSGPARPEIAGRHGHNVFGSLSHLWVPPSRCVTAIRRLGTDPAKLQTSSGVH